MDVIKLYTDIIFIAKRLKYLYKETDKDRDVFVKGEDVLRKEKCLWKARRSSI